VRKVALMTFKSRQKMTEMPGKDTSEDAFKEWTAKMHRTLKPILWEVCSDTYTMFKIEHPDHFNEVHDFKRKWWYFSDHKRNEDARGKAAVKHDADADGQESPAKKPKKART